MDGRGRGARAAAWGVLTYALATELAWLLAPRVLEPAPLPLSRPLAAAGLGVLAIVALRARGYPRTAGQRLAVAAVALTCAGSIAANAAGLGGFALGPWQPYLPTAAPWLGTWTAAPLLLACIAMLLGTSAPRWSTRFNAAAIAGSYVFVLAWASGSTSVDAALPGAESFPWTAAATIVLAAAASRLAESPRILTHDAPDDETLRRWYAFVAVGAVLPVATVAVLSTATVTALLPTATATVLAGVLLTVTLFLGIGFFVRSDRELRAGERRALEQAEHLALHDPLTGLANRTLAMEALARATARSRRSLAPVTVLFCDLDGLKSVNDAYGHAAGDALIVRCADRLAHAVRDEDTVARFGGDEFLVVTERLRDGPERAAFAERVLAAVGRPFALDGVELQPGLSVGIAVAEDGEHPIDIVRRADAAMYRAKAGGRGRWAVFDAHGSDGDPTTAARDAAGSLAQVATPARIAGPAPEDARERPVGSVSPRRRRRYRVGDASRGARRSRRLRRRARGPVPGGLPLP